MPSCESEEERNQLSSMNVALILKKQDISSSFNYPTRGRNTTGDQFLDDTPVFTHKSFSSHLKHGDLK